MTNCVETCSKAGRGGRGDGSGGNGTSAGWLAATSVSVSDVSASRSGVGVDVAAAATGPRWAVRGRRQRCAGSGIAGIGSLAVKGVVCGRGAVRNRRAAIVVGASPADGSATAAATYWDAALRGVWAAAAMIGASGRSPSKSCTVWRQSWPLCRTSRSIVPRPSSPVLILAR